MGKKRYDDGGDVSTPEEDTAPSGMGEIAEKGFAEAPSQTFKQAFAEARKAGDKTFSWQGKKYTTELAGEKKAAAPARAAAPEKSTPSSSASASSSAPSSRVGRASQASAGPIKRASVTDEGMAAANAKRAAQRESMGDTAISRAFRALRARGEAGAPGYAKGGSASKRADGIAQRGKTRGKMR